MIPEDDKGSWVAFGSGSLLCVSDVIDGYLARRHGTTRSGAFLDPLADKVLVLGAMFTLVARDMLPGAAGGDHRRPRVVISVYRTVASVEGVSVPASKLAQAEDARAAARGRLRPAAAGRSTPSGSGTALLWVGGRAVACSPAFAYLLAVPRHRDVRRRRPHRRSPDAL